MNCVVRKIHTDLGPLTAAATDTHLCLLEFSDRPSLESQTKRIEKHLNAHFEAGDNDVLAQTERELGEYFAGERREFTVPLLWPGTEFQQATWGALLTIPYGETRSYGQQAVAIERPTATRAVARANGDNRLAILIPCHRVIGADGKLTGYGGLLWRKQALLDLESGRKSAEQLSLFSSQ